MVFHYLPLFCQVAWWWWNPCLCFLVSSWDAQLQPGIASWIELDLSNEGDILQESVKIYWHWRHFQAQCGCTFWRGWDQRLIASMSMAGTFLSLLNSTAMLFLLCPASCPLTHWMISSNKAQLALLNSRFTSLTWCTWSTDMKQAEQHQVDCW